MRIAFPRSRRRPPSPPRLASLLLPLLAALVTAAACGSSEEPAPGAGSSGASPAPTEVAFDFATGPVVLISEGYEPPTDRVDSTGAYLPVNDQPTLVFLEAIW